MPKNKGHNYSEFQTGGLYKTIQYDFFFNINFWVLEKEKFTRSKKPKTKNINVLTFC